MSTSKTYEFEGFALHASSLKLETKAGEEVKLEPQVLQLLLLLVENHERVVSKDEINQKIWSGRIVSDASLASRLRAVRAAIGDNGSDQRLIKTIPNIGLRFVGEVTLSGPDTSGFWGKLTSAVRNRPVTSLTAVTMTGVVAGSVWLFGFEMPQRTLHAQFVKTPDAAIRYYNHKKMRDTTVEKCMRACLETTEFTCRSFDFYKRMNVCDLSAATADSAGGLKTDYELDPYDHYARKSYPPGPIELGRDDTLTPQFPELSDKGVE